jgi:hypothetical protein
MPSAILEEFNIKECYYECLERGEKGKVAIDLSIENHFKAIETAASNLDHALDLMNVIQDHIEHRLKHYTKCISKSTDNYFKYLLETYNRQLAQKIRLNIED